MNSFLSILSNEIQLTVKLPVTYLFVMLYNVHQIVQPLPTCFQCWTLCSTVGLPLPWQLSDSVPEKTLQSCTVPHMEERCIQTEKQRSSLLYGEQNLCNSLQRQLFCTRVIWRSYCLIMECYQCTNPIYACTLYNVSSKQCSGSRSHFSSWYGSGSKSFYKGEKPHAWLMHKAWFIKLSLSEWTLCV